MFSILYKDLGLRLEVQDFWQYFIHSKILTFLANTLSFVLPILDVLRSKRIKISSIIFMNLFCFWTWTRNTNARYDTFTRARWFLVTGWVRCHVKPPLHWAIGALIVFMVKMFVKRPKKMELCGKVSKSRILSNNFHHCGFTADKVILTLYMLPSKTKFCINVLILYNYWWKNSSKPPWKQRYPGKWSFFRIKKDVCQGSTNHWK